MLEKTNRLVNRYQFKGILISLLFIALGFVLGIDLGRFFWIAIVFFLAVSALYFTGWLAVKALRRRRQR